MARFAEIKGGYVYLEVDGVEYRVYYEEAGEGVPIYLQHTAAGDGRQWRHMLEDPDFAAKFRMVAPDLPFHGKSLPPQSEAWWAREYRLTKAFFEEFILAFCGALGMDNPVYMGTSMGGHMAVDLAIDHPDAFRAVIGLEAGMHTRPPGFDKALEWYSHPRMSNEWKPALMYTIMAPQSPEPFRRETSYVYSQSAPMVFGGDLAYYNDEHDVSETARTVDTRRIPVYILGGEYDWSGTPAVCRALADEIAGSYYCKMEGLGHFPMCENPERFKTYIKPVLDDVLDGCGMGRKA